MIGYWALWLEAGREGGVGEGAALLAAGWQAGWLLGPCIAPDPCSTPTNQTP